MNFDALKAEVAARGFDALGDTRLGYFVNDARQRLDNRYLWPYREKSATGLAPLTVVDLGTIEAVVNVDLDYQLRPSTFQALLDMFGDLAQTGTPEFFYVGTPEGTPEVATCPVATGQIGVQYWRRTPKLVNGEDIPAAPDDYHLLIVEMAVQRAYMDRDNIAAAAQLQPFIDQQIQEMASMLLGGQQIAGAGDFMALSDFSCDG